MAWRNNNNCYQYNEVIIYLRSILNVRLADFVIKKGPALKRIGRQDDCPVIIGDVERKLQRPNGNQSIHISIPSKAVNFL